MPSSDECGHELPPDLTYDELPMASAMTTRAGRELTRTWIEAQANEAEEGYDVDQLRNVGPSVHHVHDDETVSGGDT